MYEVPDKTHVPPFVRGFTIRRTLIARKILHGNLLLKRIDVGYAFNATLIFELRISRDAASRTETGNNMGKVHQWNRCCQPTCCGVNKCNNSSYAPFIFHKMPVTYAIVFLADLHNIRRNITLVVLIVTINTRILTNLAKVIEIINGHNYTT